MQGYVVAAFDTTINAIASALNEIVRMETSIQMFSRVTTERVDLDAGAILPSCSPSPPPIRSSTSAGQAV